MWAGYPQGSDCRSRLNRSQALALGGVGLSCLRDLASPESPGEGRAASWSVHTYTDAFGQERATNLPCVSAFPPGTGPGETEIGECAHSASHSAKALKWLLLPSPCSALRPQQKTELLSLGNGAQMPLRVVLVDRGRLPEAWGHCPMAWAELSPSQPVSYGGETKPESRGEHWGGAWLSCPLLWGPVGYLGRPEKGHPCGKGPVGGVGGLHLCQSLGRGGL